MGPMESDNLIGIDGGGTSCRFALIHDGTRYEVQTGPANASTDLDGTVATIRDGLGQVAELAGLPFDVLIDARGYFGLAGAISPEIAAKVADRLPFRRVTISDDSTTALVGALGGADGAVVSIGTGSFLACQDSGRTRLIGGHGLQLGDQASGAWLGRELLVLTLLAADGVQPHSALTRATFARFHDNTADIVDFGRTAAPHEFGSFAPDIAKAAREGDSTATALMQRGAEYITSGLAALGWQATTPLVLLGGVGASYAPFLPEKMTARLITAKGSALDGALALAASTTP